MVLARLPPPDRQPGRLLSLDFGLRSFANWDDTQRLRAYRQFGTASSCPRARGRPSPSQVVAAEEEKGFELTTADRLLYRTRYFTDCGVIGTKAYFADGYPRFEDHFTCRHPSNPR